MEPLRNITVGNEFCVPIKDVVKKTNKSDLFRPVETESAKLLNLFIEKNIIDEQGNLAAEFCDTPFPKPSQGFGIKIEALMMSKIIEHNGKSLSVQDILNQMCLIAQMTSDTEIIGGYLRNLIISDPEIISTFLKSLNIEEEIQLSARKAPPDCDIRSTFLSIDDNTLGVICGLIKRFVEDHIKKKLDVELVKFKPVFFNGANHYGTLTFKKADGFHYEFLIVKKLDRRYLFRHDAICLEILPPNLYKFASDFGIAPLIDLMTQTLHVPYPQTVNLKGWPLLISYYTRGWTLGDGKEIEQLLLNTSREQNCKKTLDTLLSEALKSHHFDDPEAGPALFLNAYIASEDASLTKFFPRIKGNTLLGSISALIHINKAPIDLIFVCLQMIAILHLSLPQKHTCLVRHRGELSIQIKTGNQYLILPFCFEKSIKKIVSEQCDYIVTEILRVWIPEIHAEGPSQLTKLKLPELLFKSISDQIYKRLPSHPLAVPFLAIEQMINQEMNLREEIFQKSISCPNKQFLFSLLEHVYPNDKKLFQNAKMNSANSDWILHLIETKEPKLCKLAVELLQKPTKEIALRVARGCHNAEYPELALTVLQNHISNLKGDEILFPFKVICSLANGPQGLNAARERLNLLLKNYAKQFMPQFHKFMESYLNSERYQQPEVAKFILSCLKKGSPLPTKLIACLFQHWEKICNVFQNHHYFEEIHEFISFLITIKPSLKKDVMTGGHFLWSLEELTKHPPKLNAVEQALQIFKELHPIHEKCLTELAHVIDTFGKALPIATAKEHLDITNFYLKRVPEIYGKGYQDVFHKSIISVCLDIAQSSEGLLCSVELLNKYQPRNSHVWCSIIGGLSNATDTKTKLKAIPILFLAEERKLISELPQERNRSWVSAFDTARFHLDKEFFELVDQMISDNSKQYLFMKEALSDVQRHGILYLLLLETLTRVFKHPYTVNMANRIICLRNNIIALDPNLYIEKINLHVLETMIEWGKKHPSDFAMSIALDLLKKINIEANNNTIFEDIVTLLKLYKSNHDTYKHHLIIFEETGKVNPTILELFKLLPQAIVDCTCLSPVSSGKAMIELLPLLIDFTPVTAYELLKLKEVESSIGSDFYYDLWSYYIRKDIHRKILQPNPNYKEILQFFLDHHIYVMSDLLHKFVVYIDIVECLSYYLAYDETCGLNDFILDRVLSLIRNKEELLYLFLEKLSNTHPAEDTRIETVCSFIIVGISQLENTNEDQLRAICEKFISMQNNLPVSAHLNHLSHVFNLIKIMAGLRKIPDHYILGWAIFFSMAPENFLSPERYQEALLAGSLIGFHGIIPLKSFKLLPKYVQLLGDMQGALMNEHFTLLEKAYDNVFEVLQQNLQYKEVFPNLQDGIEEVLEKLCKIAEVTNMMREYQRILNKWQNIKKQ